MSALLIIILSLSIVAQMVAAIQAVRLISVTGRRAVWVIFLACVLLMLVNRVAALHDLATGLHEGNAVSLASALSMCAISLTMAIGIALIGPIFRGLFDARALLQKERDFAGTLIQTAPTYFVAIDAQGKTMMMNSAMLAALGKEADDVVGSNYLENFVPKEEHERLNVIFESIRGGKDVTSIRNHIVTHDGTRRLVEWSGAPVRNAQGEMEYFFGVGMDRTDMLSLEEQLRHAQKMEAVGRLAGGIAHDFNNILTTVQGHAERLREDLPEGSEAGLSAQRILEASRSAAEFTRQLLVFSRKQVAQTQVLNLNAVVTEMEPLLSRTSGDDIVLNLQLDDDLRNLSADRANLEQVILNLVVNARDAMPTGGQLTISTSNQTPDAQAAIRLLDLEPGHYVCLSVSDTGMGMGEEVQRQLFEPFFTTKGHLQGTGLGLAIVYGVVKGLGGTIQVNSAPERGARFDIYFPSTEAQVTPVTATVSQGRKSGRGETILVVEDNDGVRELTVAILESAHYTVHSAEDPLRALALVRRQDMPPDLLLTDVVMPNMSGRDLAEKLRDIHPRLKVLYMSGYTDSVLSRRTELPEGLQFIQKPFTSKALLRAVDSALKLARSTKASL